MTGLPNCEGNVCAYVDEGMMLPQGALITDGGKNIELLTLGVCPQTVAIAIGGGGYGDLGVGGGRGGGGSGYVEYTLGWQKQGYVKMQAYSGCEREDSYVKDIADNSLIVRGGRGLNGNGADGGAGDNFPKL